MCGTVAEVDEGSQEPVDEHEQVLRTGAHRALPRQGGKPGLMTLVSQRTYPGNEFSDPVGRHSRDPAVADDRCASHGPTTRPCSTIRGLRSHRLPCTSSLGRFAMPIAILAVKSGQFVTGVA